MSCICQISATQIKTKMCKNCLALGLRSGAPEIQRRGVIATEATAQTLAGLVLCRDAPAEAADHDSAAGRCKRCRNRVRRGDVRKRIGGNRAD